MSGEDTEYGQVGKVFWLARIEELRYHVMSVRDSEDYILVSKIQTSPIAFTASSVVCGASVC